MQLKSPKARASFSRDYEESFEMSVLARKHRSSNRIGLSKIADELSEDADRTIRQIFGNSDDESD